MGDNNADERDAWSAAEPFPETPDAAAGVDCAARFAHVSQHDAHECCVAVFFAPGTEMQPGKENPMRCVTSDAVVLAPSAAAQRLRCQAAAAGAAATRGRHQEPEEQDEQQAGAAACASERGRTMDASVLGSCTSAMSLQDFEKLGFLGMGGAAIVYLVRHRASRVLYAMKVQQTARSDPENRQTQRALKEQQILEALQHPFVARLHFAFEDGENLCLVLEFCEGGSLKDLQVFYGGMLSEREVLFYAAEVVVALEYVHTIGIVYRDLKPENILLGDDGHIRLTDFGVAQQGDPTRSADADAASTTKFQSCPWYGVDDRVRLRSNSFVGTMDYMPPEMILQKSRQSTDLDWWALGCLLYELLFGSPPFRDNEEQETQENQSDPAALFTQIVKCQASFPATPKVSDASKDLIRKLLVKDPRKRLGHRIGAGEIKQHAFFRSTEWALLGHMEPPVAVTRSDRMCFERFRPENLREDIARELLCFEEHLGLTASTESSRAFAAARLRTFHCKGNHAGKSDDEDCNQIQMVSAPSPISSSDTLDEEMDRILDDQSLASCQCVSHGSVRSYERKETPASTPFKDAWRQLSDSFRQPSLSPGAKEAAFTPKMNATDDALKAWNTFTDRAAAFFSEALSKA